MAVGDKIQLAFKSEVDVINVAVTNLNTTVNSPSTGLTDRVTAVDTKVNSLSTDLNPRVAALETDKHSHTNKAVLDLITAEFTIAEKAKLGNLTDTFKGLFADSAARDAAIPAPVSGYYVLQLSTDTIWYYNGTTWVNTGTASSGDMTKAVYDPTNKAADAFSMGNMVETSTNKIMTSAERNRLSLYRAYTGNADSMAAMSNVLLGSLCVRGDTDSVWVYNGSTWVNSADMVKTVYDPTNKATDAFSMGSMVETATKKVMTNVERDKVALYRGHVADNAAMLALTSPVNGNYCTRADTKSVWIYSGGGWNNADTKGSITGDTKFSYRTTDHDGWYSLNGRAISTLPAAAQAAATALGWASSLPDTRGRLAMAASATYPSGSNGGSSTILRSNLPLFTLSGNTGNESQGHTHTTNAYSITGQSTSSSYATNSTYSNVACFQNNRLVRSEAGGYIAGTDISYMTLVGNEIPMDNVSTIHSHNFSVPVPLTTSNGSNQSHTHSYTTSNINDTGSQAQFIPAHSSKTEFVFLGL